MHISNSWVFLSIAITFGVLGTVSMKLSDGLEKWKPSLSLLIFYFISFIAMTMALKGIDMSIVYSVWSGIGTILVAVAGIFLFDESISLKKFISLCFIVMGVVGIYLNYGLH